MKRVSFWIARYVHDLIFYLPISFMVASMVSQYDTHMELAPTLVFLQPFAALPFIYVWSFMFSGETQAMISLVLYQLFVSWYCPYFLIPIRTAADNEIAGDGLFGLFKAIAPLGATGCSFMFNSEILN